MSLPLLAPELAELADPGTRFAGVVALAQPEAEPALSVVCAVVSGRPGMAEQVHEIAIDALAGPCLQVLRRQAGFVDGQPVGSVIAQAVDEVLLLLMAGYMLADDRLHPALVTALRV